MIEIDRKYDEITILPATQEATKKYGHCHGYEIIGLSEYHIQALKDGRMLAWNDGEYSTFLVFIQQPEGQQ